MHRLISTIRRTIRAALSAGQALITAVRGFRHSLLVDLFRAIDAASLVEITYAKPDGTTSTRVIEPAELRVTEAGAITVRAFDRSRGEDRTFRIDRITHYRPLEAAVTARPADANRPSESLRYERDLIAHVIETGAVRPEVAASMGHRAEQIDAELANRDDDTAGARASVARLIRPGTGIAYGR